MINIALIAGTYQPERCGGCSLHRLPPERLSEQDIQSVVLTTQLPFANDPSIRGAVQDWKFADLLLLAKAVHGTALIFCIFNTLPVLTGLNVPYSCCRC